MPVPYFDESDTPDSVTSLYRQKANWFFGPLQAFQYYKYILEKNRWCKQNKLYLFVLSSKLFSYALYWVLGPTFFAFLLLFALVNKFPLSYFVIAWASFLLLPNFVAWLVIKKTFDVKILLNLVIGSIPCYILHGLSAYRSFWKILYSVFSGGLVKKEKTLMIVNKIK